jgi:radical SAM protein with 4Fe4S-binding SPASM domain
VNYDKKQLFKNQKELLRKLVAQDKLIKGLEHVVNCYRKRELCGPPLTLKEVENEAIRRAMIFAKGNRKQAAKILGIGERTMYRKIKENPMPNQHQSKKIHMMKWTGPESQPKNRKCKSCTYYRHCGHEEPCSMWDEGDVVTRLV